MELIKTDRQLEIHLTLGERFLAVHFGSVITIPLAEIVAVTTTKPTFSWRTIRAPGTSIPWVVSAGTFYTENGREFWFMNRDRDYLVLKVPTGYYKRIVLTTPENSYWQGVLAECGIPTL